MAIVYKHIRKDNNEIFYIGIGKNLRRAYTKNSRNCYWKNIAKNGYFVEIIYENLTWEEACNKEVELINQYGRKDIGTGILANMTDGGEGLINISSELRERFSKIAKQRTFSSDTRKKMSISQSRPYDEKYPNFQNVLKQRRDKMIEFNKNYVASEETNKKISETLKGKTFSQEHKIKQKQAAIKRWGNEELKKQVELFISENPKSSVNFLMDKFNITRSFVWRLKNQMKSK